MELSLLLFCHRDWRMYLPKFTCTFRRIMKSGGFPFGIRTDGKLGMSGKSSAQSPNTAVSSSGRRLGWCRVVFGVSECGSVWVGRQSLARWYCVTLLVCRAYTMDGGCIVVGIWILRVAKGHGFTEGWSWDFLRNDTKSFRSSEEEQDDVIIVTYLTSLQKRLKNSAKKLQCGINLIFFDSCR